MKTIWKWICTAWDYIWETVLGIVVFVIAIPTLLLWCVVYTPVDIIRWWCSPYRRDFGGKYPWMVSQTNPYFLIYNLIHRKHLPIRFYRDDTVKVACFGWFVYEDTLILPDMGWEYDEEQTRWVTEEDKQTVVLDEAWIQRQMDNCNRAAGEEVCRQALLLCEEDELLGNDSSVFAPLPNVRMTPVYETQYRDALRKITGAKKG